MRFWAAESSPPPPCPRPDKRAFDTEAECRETFRTLFATDGQLRAYLCPCGWWHAGHPYIDDALRIAAVARIIHTTEETTTP